MNAKSRVCLRIAVLTASHRPRGRWPRRRGSGRSACSRARRAGTAGACPGSRGRVPSGLADRVAEQRADVRARLAERDRLVAAAGLEAHVRAVAVEVLALAGEADHRVPELLVVLLVRGERAVLDLDVAGRQHDLASGTSRRRSACGKRSTLASMTLREVARRRAELVDEALQLGRRDERAGLRDPRERGVDRRGRLADAGQDLAGEGARVRERGVEAVERAVRARERRAEPADRGPQVRRLRRRRAERRVEVRDEVLELGLVAAQALGRAVQARQQARQVARLRAVSASVTSAVPRSASRP